MHKTMAKPPSRPTATSAASPKPTAKADAGPRVIAENRRARFDYFIEERYEAGLALEGWEVKALRAGKAQITEAHVYLRGGEVFMGTCPDCSSQLEFAEGCVKCHVCGFSECG